MAIKKICGAKNRRGLPCQVAPMTNGRCRLHGGATPVGPASVHFKHGRRSILLKEFGAFGQHYERALADPDLLRMDDEIALVDARLSELLERASQAKGEQKTLDGIWPQLDALIENRRKLVDTESKRLKDLHAMVSIDRVMTLVAYMTDTVRRHVRDPKVLGEIFNDLRKVLKPTEGGS